MTLSLGLPNESITNNTVLNVSRSAETLAEHGFGRTGDKAHTFSSISVHVCSLEKAKLREALKKCHIALLVKAH